MLCCCKLSGKSPFLTRLCLGGFFVLFLGGALSFLGQLDKGAGGDWFLLNPSSSHLSHPLTQSTAMEHPWYIDDGWQKKALKKGLKTGTAKFDQYYEGLVYMYRNNYKVPTIAG